MNVRAVMLSFAGWILVALVFECLYAIVSRFAVCRIEKHYLCEGYWFVASLTVFLSINRLMEFAELLPALIVCGVHCALSGQFTLLRSSPKIGTTRPSSRPYSSLMNQNQRQDQVWMKDKGR